MKKMLLIFSAISLNGAISAMKNGPQNNPSSHHNKSTPVTLINNDDKIDHKQADVDRKIKELSARKKSIPENPAPEKQDLSKEEIGRQIAALADKGNPQLQKNAKL